MVHSGGRLAYHSVGGLFTYYADLLSSYFPLVYCFGNRYERQCPVTRHTVDSNNMYSVKTYEDALKMR